MTGLNYLGSCHCGVYVGAIIEARGGYNGIINTHELRDVPADIADVVAISYDNENMKGRVSRREDRWTPVGEAPSF